MNYLRTLLQGLTNPQVLDDTSVLKTPLPNPLLGWEPAVAVPESDIPATHQLVESQGTARVSLSIGVLATGLGVLAYGLSQMVEAGGLNVLAALAGVSALLYLGAAFDASSPGEALLHLAVGGMAFAFSVAGVESSVYFVALAFLLHGLWGSVNTLSQRSGSAHFSKPFLAWSVFNVTLALLVIFV